MLAQMARQTVNRAIEFNEGVGARMMAGQTSLLHLGGEFEGVRVIAIRKQIGKSVDDVVGDVQRFADFARGAASAIGNDVGGHGRAVFAVTAINFLDDALTPVAAGQVDVDVGPALAAFA